ncbi:uncharacterized protein LOC123538315 isoform X1 [Mercenaria mercenaria]|uniref:uncharacterized protein LOC123538315 isoform X1 n=1 Tax=Mercenaria mercenaria TaxID=6596 RepID=UPI00234F5185|nr:uncharacterized protein LOC123538315 isoform X1 [Mercenaria mercenaria]XP_053386188.1 uncharacterized protein LOC123538315 isoform X1 [Mercenaria mercenaria]
MTHLLNSFTEKDIPIPRRLVIAFYEEIKEIEGVFKCNYIPGPYNRDRPIGVFHKAYIDLAYSILESKGTLDWAGVLKEMRELLRNYLEKEYGAIDTDYSRTEEETTPKATDTIYSRTEEETTPKATDTIYSRTEEETTPKDCDRKGNSVRLEDLYGNTDVIVDVRITDSVETLMSKIERKHNVPKHELVLFCNGTRLEEKQMLQDYDIDTSSIQVLRQRKKVTAGKETMVLCDFR